MSVVCCVGSGLRDELIARSEESYRMCVPECDLETSTMRRPRPMLGCWTTEKKISEFRAGTHKFSKNLGDASNL